jgi:thioredoxin reductase (NADPH)
VAEPYRSPTLDARRPQMFPVLADEELARMRRFGTVRHFVAGERLFETGKPSPGMFVVLSGAMQITGRDGHGRDFLIAELSSGGFSGEIGQLSGRRALADGIATGEVEALLISPEQLRAPLVSEAALGEEIMRALIQDYLACRRLM